MEMDMQHRDGDATWRGRNRGKDRIKNTLFRFDLNFFQNQNIFFLFRILFNQTTLVPMIVFASVAMSLSVSGSASVTV